VGHSWLGYPRSVAPQTGAYTPPVTEPDRDQPGSLTPSSLINQERGRDRAGVLAPHKRLVGAIGACALIVVAIFAYNAFANRACTVAFTSSTVTVTFSGQDASANCSHTVDVSPPSAGAHVLSFWDQPAGSLVCQGNLQGSVVVVKRDTGDASSAAFAGSLCAATQQ
jgi:hypothetical protein